MSEKRIVHVAVAVIRDDAGRVLVAQRLPHQHLAGLWEFPGGKVELGETLEAGMQREIREELGIEVETLAPLLRIEHTYPEKTVLLDVWRVTRWSGPAPGNTGSEGQPLRWLHPRDMIAAEFPPADVPIIAALKLPPRYVISPDVLDHDDIATFVARLPGLNAQLVQVRLKQAPQLAFALIKAIRAAVPAATILINSDTQDAAAKNRESLCGADGMHFTTRALRAMKERPSFLCAASCHDEEELAAAYRLALDFVTLSPVLATMSHPGVSPLGWLRFRDLATGAGLPVYALGGMRADMLFEAEIYGAIGIAGISFADQSSSR